MKNFRRIFLSILTLALCLWLRAGASGINDGTDLKGLGRVDDAWSRSIYPGANFSRIVSHNGFNQRTNLVDFYPTDLGLEPVVTFGDYIYGGERLGDMVQEYDDMGYKVIYAINGDSFFWNGIPKGTIIKDGILHKTGASYLTALGFDYNNRPMYGNPRIQISAYLHGDRIPISAINENRDINMNPAYIFTDRFSTTTRSTKEGVELVIDIETPGYEGLRMETTVSGRVKEVRQVSENTAETPINKGQVVITAYSQSPFYTKLSSARPGDTIDISVISHDPNNAWENARMAIGVFRPLKENGILTKRAQGTDLHPRTALALRSDGLMRIMQNDGRMQSARGISYKETVDFLSISNFENVLAFDGGGSSTFYATLPGFEDARILNEPSDRFERPIGNALLFVKPRQEGTGVEKLHIYPNGDKKTEVTMDAGTAINLDVRATDAKYDPVKFDLSQVTFTSDSGGTGRVNKFVAGPRPGKGVITAHYPNGASGQVRLLVKNNIVSISHKDGPIDIGAGQSTPIRIQANIPGGAYDLDPQALTYELSDPGLGSISQDGVFQADGYIGQGTIRASFGDHSLDIGLNVSGYSGLDPSPIARLAGDNRFATAGQIAAEFGFSEYALLADANNFPDALVAASLAHHYKAPILLASGEDLPQETKTSLESLGVSKIIILGGINSVSQAIEDDLRTQGYRVERIAGANRYETAVNIASKLPAKDYIYLASGENYPDALSLTSLATRDGLPILLTAKDNLPVEIENYIDNNAISNIVIAGGQGSVSPNVLSQLEAKGISVERIGGADRFETSALISQRAYPKENGYMLANGFHYIDALTAGPLAGLSQRPILLVRPESLPGPAKKLLAGAPANKTVVIGGYNSVSQGVQRQVEMVVE